jgi:phosphoserine phosphatase RsbU/P
LYAQAQVTLNITESTLPQALSMELVDGASRRTVVIDRFPFVVGRSCDCNLVLPQSYISRIHATISRDGAQLVLEDAQSRHGTFVNGAQTMRRKLQPGDRIQFGSCDAPQLRVTSEDKHTTTGPNILSQLHGISAQHSDLEKLRWFLEAARELNSAGQVDRVLASLLETTLALAKVECGFVFLTGASGALELALGRDATGRVLTDAPTVSRTVLRQATRGTDQFIVTDTLSAEGDVPESIVINSILTIICIPLRRTRQTRHGESAEDTASRQVFGPCIWKATFSPADSPTSITI